MVGRRSNGHGRRPVVEYVRPGGDGGRAQRRRAQGRRVQGRRAQGRPVRRPGVTGRGQQGAVTAEAVMVMPLLALISVAMCWLVSLGAQQAQIVDAARETARLIARDVPQTEAVAAGRQVAPEGAEITVQVTGDEVRVRVEVGVAPFELLGFAPSGALSATAVAAKEES